MLLPQTIVGFVRHGPPKLMKLSGSLNIAMENHHAFHYCLSSYIVYHDILFIVIILYHIGIWKGIIKAKKIMFNRDKDTLIFYQFKSAGCLCLRAENRTSKMQVFDVSHMGGFGGVGGVITFLASVSR